MQNKKSYIMVKQGKYENTIEVTLTEKNTPILFKKKLEELMEQKAFDSETEAKKWIENTPIVLCLVYHKHSGLYAVEDDAVDSTFSPYDSVVPTDTLNEDPEGTVKKIYQPVMLDTNDVPEELYDYMVFPTREDCRFFMDNKFYVPGEYQILEHDEDDIEDYLMINKFGHSIQSEETELDLDEVYNYLFTLLACHDEPVEISKTKLSSSDNIVFGIGDDKPYWVEKIDCEYIYLTNGEQRRLDAIQDIDDYNLLTNAVETVIRNVR